MARGRGRPNPMTGFLICRMAGERAGREGEGRDGDTAAMRGTDNSFRGGGAADEERGRMTLQLPPSSPPNLGLAYPSSFFFLSFVVPSL